MGTMSTADGPALVDKAMAILQPPRAMSLPARSDMEQGLQEASSTIGRSLSQGFKSFGQEVSDSIDVLKSAIGKAASNVKEPRKGGDSNEKSEEGVASGAAQQSAREWIAAWRNRQD